ncbi:MAG: PEP-CTERM sorting domain-containing protein [Sphingomonas sp.]|nr:PEP-CTERM sorting domain-containing protein [Sphingomonas sp.]
MKKAYLLSVALGAFALPSAALAVVPIDGTFTVSQYYGDSFLPGGQSNGGLEIDVSPSSGSFSTTSGASPIGLFNISTPEGSVEWDDLIKQSIVVDFLFTNPAGAAGSVGGQTYARTIGILSDGFVKWSPVSILFGSGNSGQLDITLGDTSFDGSFGTSLGNKPGLVKASFNLVKAAVPEPATWAMMIVGIGFAGAGMRRRQSVSVRYA